MRRVLAVVVFTLLVALQLAFAGAGNDQPANITVANPYQDNINWAQFCWTTNNISDSLVMIGTSNFDRQVYDPTMTTNHCVVVKNLEPNTLYAYSVASCTDPQGGKPCAITDTNWSVAPWPTNTPDFTTPQFNNGPPTFELFAWGPDYVYQNKAINVGISLIQTGANLDGNDVMMVMAASIDGQSCLPGTQLGANCGSTNVALTILCPGSEWVSPSTNNYNVNVYEWQPWPGNYFCWNGYFAEPGIQPRILPGQLGDHTLSLTFQLVDFSTHTVVGDPQTVTYPFTVLAPANFVPTRPTQFPPVPNVGAAMWVAASGGTQKCEELKSSNQQGIWINGSLSVTASEYDPWNIYSYDGNRVFKQLADVLNGATGPSWQPNHVYNYGDLIVASNGTSQVVQTGGVSGPAPPDWSQAGPGGRTQDGTVLWVNGENRAYWTACSNVIGMQFLNWAVNIARWDRTAEWNVFPWGMYMDFERQGDVLNENCMGGPTCSGLNAMSNLRFGANIMTYPAPGFNDENFVYTDHLNQTSGIRALPYNTNVLLVDWLETGIRPTSELQKRVDLLIQTVSEAIKYSPLDGPNNYTCCYSAANFNVGLWADSLIHVYDVEYFLNSSLNGPDARIPIELMKLLDWFYLTQVNLLGNDYTFPFAPWSVPYNCSIFENNDCNTSYYASLNMLVAPAYAWLGAVYGDNCMLPTSKVKCWDAADLLFSHAWAKYTGSGKNLNQLFEGYSNYMGWRTGAFPGTDSYVLPTHNPSGTPYPDIVGPYPSGLYPAKPMAGNITDTTATIAWYTFEKAVSTVVKVGTDPNNINQEIDCGPGVYTGTDNVWINTCEISGLTPNTLYYFGVGGTDAAHNSAFSPFDVTNYLQGDYLNFATSGSFSNRR